MKRLISAAMPLAVAVAPILLASAAVTPANAIIVFDPTNYSQNLLTAARSLQQINNQIQSLQNQATSLMNQARNLQTIGFPELTVLTSALQQIQTLMGQAQGIQLRAQGLEQQFRHYFPTSFNASLTNDEHVADASARYSTAMVAYQHTMTVQAQVVEDAQSDAEALATITDRSQSAVGALQASQATNQLLALTAKQQFQIEQMMAAQYRAQAIDQARRDQAQADGQAATARFLGSGAAYTPQ